MNQAARLGGLLLVSGGTREFESQGSFASQNFLWDARLREHLTQVAASHSMALIGKPTRRRDPGDHHAGTRPPVCRLAASTRPGPQHAGGSAPQDEDIGQQETDASVSGRHVSVQCDLVQVEDCIVSCMLALRPRRLCRTYSVFARH